ncbi:response regulator [Bacteroidota bacterium]
MKSILIVILFFIFYVFPLNTFSQNSLIQGNPYIQNYNNEDYLTSENQTWAIAQDQRGVMYFGNNDGLLEFDGSKWQLYELPNKSTVRSLTFDNNSERLYVGAVGDFGYFQSDSIGVWKYVSLLEKVLDEHNSFEDVWQVVILNDQIIFRTTPYIFIFKNNKIKTLIPEDRFHTSFLLNNQFYVREWGKGLFKLVNDSLEFIGQSGIFANERIYVMLPYKNDKILIATRTQGIYIYSPVSETSRFIKPEKFKKIDNFLISNQTYSGIKLPDNKFAIGTFNDGLIIFDENGNIIQHINKQSGLQDNDVLSITSDSQNNIWVGLNNGISCIILNSPFSVYNENNGLQGTVYRTKTFKNRLYAGTSLGLYVKDQLNNFTLVENTRGQCWHLIAINNELFLGHTDGVFKINNNTAQNIIPVTGAVWKLNKIKDKPYILLGTNNGLIILEFNGKDWSLKQKIKGFEESSRYMEIDDLNNIWVSHPNKGVYKILLNSSLDSIVKLDSYSTNNGLPAYTQNYVFKIKIDNQKSEIVFGTEKGIYKFNPQINQFIPDKRFDILLNNEGFIDQFIQDEQGNIYYQQGDKQGILLIQSDRSYKIERTPFLKFKGLFMEEINIIDSTHIFYGNKDGILQYSSEKKLNYNDSYNTVIREVYANDSLLYGGKQEIDRLIELPYKFNYLQYTFSALYYEDHNKTTYSYFLEGFNKQWSEWSLKTEKEYTNLPPGNYIFKVKAKNVYEKESNIAEFKFVILTPWYRSILAYILYGLIIFIFIRYVVKFYTWSLKRDKEILENTVKARTTDLHEINTKLEEKQADLEVKQEEITAQAEHLERANKELEKHRMHLEQLVNERTSELLSAKVKAEESDRLKSAFLANMSHEIRTPMNAIVGFSTLIDDPLLGTEQKEEIKYHINYNCNTLLHLIDDIIDISKIEAGQLDINKKFCNITLILKELYDSFNEHKKVIKKHDIEILISKEIEKEELTTHTDPIRFQQVMTNLIENALKYTEKGTIEIGYKIERISENEIIKFFVKDTGIGLTDQQQAVIFSRFTKIEDNKKKIYRGAGLGLAISKNIVTKLGGEIWIKSEINYGSTFYFTIPYIKEAKKGESQELLKPKISDYEWPGKTILIAEDEESNYLYFKMILSKTKTNILHAETGNKVIELCKTGDVDLVLMDIKMPDMDGLEATRILKKQNPHLPIIAQTAFAMENDEKMCKDAGCSEYIQKPIQRESLLKLINKYLSK